MSSFNTADSSEATTIKIELVKVSGDESMADNKDDAKPLNEDNKCIEDTHNVSNNDVTSARIEAGEQVQDEDIILGSNHYVEVPITGVRYFKGIGKADSSGHCSKDVVGITPVPDVAHSGAAKPVLPGSLGNLPKDNAGSSNESRFPIIKPPTYKDIKYGKVELYAPDVGPRIYNVKGNIISRPIITKNLPEAFRAQPVHGKAESKANLPDFFEQKLRDYVGYGISDNEFEKLHEFMNGDYLRTGLECTTPYSFPSQGPLSVDLKSTRPENGPGQNLCVVKKLKLRIKKDAQNHYPRKLKYRGLRMLPLSIGDEDHVKELLETNSGVTEDEDGPLEPGRDLIFRARVYRPHSYGSKDHRDNKPTRHSVFNNDLVILGRQRLTAFRDRIACANDIGMRIDVSENPEAFTTQSAKQMFPSGFLFINNVFYVDNRVGCVDHSAGIREWARKRQLGDFPVRDMGSVRLDEIVLRLGHPEVYMHQGKCEHLFTFSEVRLLNCTDPMRLSYYPCFTHISQNQSVYCTTCAEFGAKWIVVGCSRVPFDPAFFCDTCFKFYLYDREGNKIGNFKAYSYKGNTVNFLKPIVGVPSNEEEQNDCEEDSD